MAVQTAIAETVRRACSVGDQPEKRPHDPHRRGADVRTDGAPVWIGPPNLEPPERPLRGPLK
ncbi:hypothetical protein AWC01_03570 [Mycobacterium doricum]|uniref:Uncharacterized protein n=1 Tax=Mycolicibacterium doricum TaxID=126673 RepID=A0A1X1TIF8_9MYCO|nr:hypothetical protein AWC01_03570 [Mycolicibacterium doricum]